MAIILEPGAPLAREGQTALGETPPSCLLPRIPLVYAPAVSSFASAASANRLSGACASGTLTSGAAAGSTTVGSRLRASSSAASGRLSFALGCVSVWTALS